MHQRSPSLRHSPLHHGPTRKARRALLALLLGCVACGTTSFDDAAESASESISDHPPDATSSLVIRDRATLDALEAGGFGLGDVLATGGSTLAQIHSASAAYGTIVQEVASEVAARSAEIDRLDGGRSAGVGIDFAHRMFDARWLSSERSRFALVAVVNRLDQMDEGTCGYVRFVYRLEYDPPRNRPRTRLPMTLVVSKPQPRTAGCGFTARRWLALESASTQANPPLEALGRYTNIEINYQIMHELAQDDGPSGAHSMDDHAEYVLRGFAPDGSGDLTPLGVMAPRPDAREEVARWIREAFVEIDAGRATLPPELRERAAHSATPRGLSRLVNRPFLEMFEPAEFADMAERFAGARMIKSPAGLLRRLDGMTCGGCHQSRSIAGFHILGDEAPTDFALVSGFSRGFGEQLEWRHRHLEAIAKSNAFDEPVPFAERHRPGFGGYGEHCAVTADPTFDGWQCASSIGLECRPVHEGDAIGECVPTVPGLGDPCARASLGVRSNDPRHPDGAYVTPPASTAVCSVPVEWSSITGPYCGPNHNGWPGGACRGNGCSRLGERREDGVCGPIFNIGFEGRCFRGPTPLEDCLRAPGNIVPLVMRYCDHATPCRDDYTCVRIQAAGDGGMCLPPYALLSTRVDGPTIDRVID